MKLFARLINDLDSTNKTNLKLAAIERYLAEANDEDKLWFLSLFTGKRPKRITNTQLLRQWALELANIPQWLFEESYASVGDLSETISLILPEQPTNIDISLTAWMQKIISLKDATDVEKKEFIIDAWQNLGYVERFIFNKLIGGSFRVGVSSKSLINAIAQHYNLDSNVVSHAIMGDWNIEEVNFEQLVRGAYSNTHLSKPYPFSLAYALDKDCKDLGLIEDWQIEYKWDGIRGQLIKRNGEVYIWSRGEELITDQFPEIRDALMLIDGNFVVDGEILPYKDGKVLNFSDLQKRLNRKTIQKKMLEEVPIAVFLYDVVEWEFEDIRQRPLIERRQLLENFINHQQHTHFYLSEIIKANNWEAIAQIREGSRAINSEGLMLKHIQSIYHTGRKKGDWWKWKIDPMTIDAVLIYAQKGSGRRSGYYTDYTFAVKDGEKLVTIAKAYSGLTDKEIQEVSKFVNKYGMEKFGPVRTVQPKLVFEIAFEGIGFSSRHKSGVALRFPRILRWRKDKTVNDIDDIEEIKKMIR